MSLRSPLTRALAATTATLAIGGLTASAFAEDVVVTANTTELPNTRVLATSPTLLLTDDGTGLGLEGTLSVTVTETGATGANPWVVTATSTDFTGTGLTTIAATNFSATPGTSSTSLSLPSGVDNVDGSAGTLDGTVELFRVTGESTTASYTNVFSQDTALSLTIPNGVDNGLRTATLTVTLTN